MTIIYSLFVFLALSLICIQDFRFRAVSWFLFPLGLVALVLWGSTAISWHAIIRSQVLNLSFLLFQITLLFAVFRVKGVNPSTVLKKYLGSGDLLFFLVLALGLPTDIFLIFFIISLILSLIAGLIFFKKGTIPLAGIQSGLLCIVIALHTAELFNIYALNLLFI